MRARKSQRMRKHDTRHVIRATMHQKNGPAVHRRGRMGRLSHRISTLLPVETAMVMVMAGGPVSRIAPGSVATNAHTKVDTRLYVNRTRAGRTILRAHGHPLANGAAITVITDDLIHGGDWGAV